MIIESPNLCIMSGGTINWGESFERVLNTLNPSANLIGVIKHTIVMHFFIDKGDVHGINL